MAEETRSSIAILGSTSHIPIAQLTPLLSAPSSRSIKAVVTLIWPYSSATKAVAFLLAEPDFRLRRTRGQVRVQFSGSSANKITASRIESGDEVILSLDGVEFVHGEAVPTPGRGVEFELRFTERLLLQSQQQETQKLNILDINHPEPENQTPINGARILTPEPEPDTLSVTSTPRRGEVKLADDEFSSPAFIKRARTSYGSLWEDGFELADGSVKGKGRKRTRLSRTWTVDNQEDTPDSPESVRMEELEIQASPIASKQYAQQSTTMMDEGVQTENSPGSLKTVEIEELEPQSSQTRLEPTTKQSNTVMDGGVQTEDLEAGVSETLLEFARQATNTTTAYETPELATDGGKDIGGFQVPSAIFTRFGSRQEDQAHDQPPSSPRLQPLSSESLPLVSPLLSRNVASFAESVGQPLKQAQVFREGFTPVPKIFHVGQKVHEYDNESSHVSPGIHRKIQVSAEHDEVMDGDLEFDGSHLPVLERQIHSEHQYGDWERQTDVSNHELSEHVVEEQDQHDRFSADGHNDYEDVESPIYPRTGIQQYPDLDEVLSQERLSSPRWEPVHDSIQYPELPDHGDNLDDLVQSLGVPQSRSTSRSVSAQSAVIDLTDTDEEDEEDEEDENGDEPRDQRLDRVPAERDHSEGSVDNEYEGVSDDGEEEYDDENELNLREPHSRSQPGRTLKEYHEPEDQEEEDEVDDQEMRDDDSQPEEEYYEDDEMDSQGNPYPRDSFRDEQQEFDDEEDSYEEDQRDESPAQPPPQREPIVIDLLSSDDEDGPASIPAIHASPRMPLRGSNEPESSDREESEGELDSNDEPSQLISAGSQRSVKVEEDNQEEEESSLHEDQQHGHVSQVRQSSISRHEDADEPSTEPVEDDPDVESKAFQRGESLPPTNLIGLDNEKASVPLREELSGDTSQEIMTSQESFESQQEEPLSSLQFVEQQSVSIFTATSNDAPEDHTELSVEIRQVETRVEIPQEMELDEVDYQAPATPGPRQDAKTNSQSTPLAFSLDGAEDEDDDEINRRRNLRESSYPAVRPSTMENSNRPSPYRPSLFSRMFGIDGANDEPEEPIVYPTLPHDESSRPSTTANSQILSQNFGVRFPIGGAVQLPTPDDTQIQSTDDVLSRHASFTSAIVTSEREVEVILEPSGEVPRDASSDPIDASEDAVVETVQESVESSRQESHDALQQHIESSQNISDDNAEELAEVVEAVNTVMDDSLAEASAIEEPEVKTVTDKPTIIEETMKLTIDETAPDSQMVDETNEEMKQEAAYGLQTKPSSDKIIIDETAAEEPLFSAEAPRRSHRRVKSTTEAVVGKENTQPIPVTPLKPSKAATPSSARSNQSPMVIIDHGSTEKGHDASIELALSSLDSPAKHYDLRRPPMTDLKLRLNRNLRTELEEYKSLKILRYELNNKKFNVLAIATSATPEPERVKNGPRHYLITFNITDPSIAPAGVTEVQIFRPYKEALPIIQVGDGILLRDFQVVSLKNRGFGLKSDPGCSSWAVFKDGVEVEVRGPPVEYGDVETNHIAQMKEWHTSLDSASVAKLRRANGDKSAGAGV